MSHSLVEIPREDWFELRDLYCDYRKEASGFGFLQTIIQWIEKEPTINIQIYALDGEWKEDGTFLFFNKGLLIPHVSFNTLNNNMERLTAALNCLDTKMTYLLFGFPARLKPAVKEHIKHAGINVDNFQPDATAWYHIAMEKALQFEIDIPADHKLSSLDEQHAEQINSIWPHRTSGSIEFVKCLIRLNDSVGLFDNAGNLIAWCLRLPLGSLGLLQVMDSHKRKGLGNLVVRYISKIIASKGEEVMAPVVVTNRPSRGMFEKLGFSVIDHTYWMLKE